MARPSVVLPEPDSPTTPTVSPSRTLIETPSTALTWPTVRRRSPRLIGNQTFRSSGARRRSARRRAARFGAALRLGGEQLARVGMLRARRRPRATGPCSTISPCVITQTRSAILRTMPRSWVMNSIAMPSRALQIGEQLQDLRLHGDVERRRRLVGDQQVGLVGERHRDHHALALPAGELVRIGAEPAPRRRACRPGRAARACARAPPRPTAPGAASGSRRPAARSCAAG